MLIAPHNAMNNVCFRMFTVDFFHANLSDCIYFTFQTSTAKTNSNSKTTGHVKENSENAENEVYVSLYFSSKNENIAHDFGIENPKWRKSNKYMSLLLI